VSQPETAPEASPPRLEFRVPPEGSHLLRARERLREYLVHYCAERELVDDVVLCVEEACTNAIRHSASADDIRIALEFTGGRLVAFVRDSGRGFDTTGFDRRDLPDLTVDHGRGLFIIANLMDRHIHGGKSVDQAKDWVKRVDLPNARLVESTKSHADVVIERDTDDDIAAITWKGEEPIISSKPPSIAMKCGIRNSHLLIAFLHRTHKHQFRDFFNSHRRLRELSRNGNCCPGKLARWGFVFSREGAT